ncbi:MAG: cysteine--tRNA ligase [Deltaproteobacteria bacterium]|nr:cysteine--tRNA ligase [Deltaproteobacteria bacterium]
MALRIYNTLTRNKRDLEPLAPPRVGMYVCGVTVYDYCHIGHARAYVAFDIVARYLRYRGLDLTYVRNFTDIDDKIINRARERGQEPAVVAQQFIDEFYRDMEALNVAPADIEPRVTEHIPDIIALVERLIAKEHGYVVDAAPVPDGSAPAGRDVYFSVRSFEPYGRLSGRDIEEMQSGARVDVDERKRDPLDFALWKAAKPGEPWWDSPWGRGRPGWHIECSVMSMKYLGHTLDIHGGGKDLVFPHHENEIAQSEAATGQPFARLWMHNGFVNVNDEKMSKSLGNFFTIRDVTARFDPEAVRYFLLTTHYRSPLNFTDGQVEEAENRVAYIYETLARVESFLAQTAPAGDGEEFEKVFARGDEPYRPRHEFEQALDDDFNTPRALGLLSELLRLANLLLDGKEQEQIGRKLKPPLRARLLAEWQNLFAPMQTVLGLGARPPAEFLDQLRLRRCCRREIDPAWVEQRLAERAAAKHAKDYTLADQIRAELAAAGVEVRDAREKTIWRVC